MVLIGLGIGMFYLVAAAGTVLLYRWLWLNRPPLPVIAVSLLGGLLLSGYLSYRVGGQRLLRMLEATRIPQAQAPGVHNRIDVLADRMNIPRPTLFVATMGAPNALAIGGTKRGALVIDRSLFRLLTADELEGIIAHELAHLKHRDSLRQTLLQGAVQSASLLLTLLLLPLLFALSGIGSGIAWIRGQPSNPTNPFARLRTTVLRGVFAVGILAVLLARSRSRRQELAADKRAADVTGKPLALARALRKIDQATDPSWVFAPFSRNQQTDSSLEEWLATHPPVDERIQRLKKLAHDSSADGTATNIPVS